jgi:hypothetical protein
MKLHKTTILLIVFNAFRFLRFNKLHRKLLKHLDKEMNVHTNRKNFITSSLLICPLDLTESRRLNQEGCHGTGM